MYLLYNYSGRQRIESTHLVIMLISFCAVFSGCQSLDHSCWIRTLLLHRRLPWLLLHVHQKRRYESHSYPPPEVMWGGNWSRGQGSFVYFCIYHLFLPDWCCVDLSDCDNNVHWQWMKQLQIHGLIEGVIREIKNIREQPAAAANAMHSSIELLKLFSSRPFTTVSAHHAVQLDEPDSCSGLDIGEDIKIPSILFSS